MQARRILCLSVVDGTCLPNDAGLGVPGTFEAMPRRPDGWQSQLDRSQTRPSY